MFLVGGWTDGALCTDCTHELHIHYTLQLWHVAWRSTWFMRAKPSSWQLGDGVWTQKARQTPNASAAAKTKASLPESILRLRWSENSSSNPPPLIWYIHLFWLKWHFLDGLFSGSTSPLFFLFMVHMLFATRFYASGLIQKWWQTRIFTGTANNCFIIRAGSWKLRAVYCTLSFIFILKTPSIKQFFVSFATCMLCDLCIFNIKHSLQLNIKLL